METRRLLTARELKQHGIKDPYRMAKNGLIPFYRVGPKRRGVRFILSEVLAALRAPSAPNEQLESIDTITK